MEFYVPLFSLHIQMSSSTYQNKWYITPHAAEILVLLLSQNVCVTYCPFCQEILSKTSSILGGFQAIYFEGEFLKQHLRELKANPYDAGKKDPTRQVCNPYDLVDYSHTCLAWELAVRAAHFHGLTTSSIPLPSAYLMPLLFLLGCHQWYQLPSHQHMWTVRTTSFIA